MPNSLVLISAQDSELKVRLLLPLTELELAVGRPLQAEPEVVEKYGAVLREYILAHVKVYDERRTADWPMELISIKADPIMDKSGELYFRELDAAISVKIPAGMNPRKFVLAYDAIIHQVVTHFAVVKVIQDFKTGTTSDHPMELGLIQLDIRNDFIPDFPVDLTPGDQWNGIKRFLMLGAEHILTGFDHLLFLLMLLLVAPLLAIGTSWTSFDSNRATLRKIIRTVTAFTIGHSMTLLLVALYSGEQLTRPVEVMIAVSIFVSAIHVLRPLFPGREMIIALIFGLVHGMAFGNSLASLGLDTSTRVLAVLTFNIGIEITQLAVIAVIIPILLLMRGRSYRFIRIPGGLFGCIASMIWIIERATGHENMLSRWLNAIHF